MRGPGLESRSGHYFSSSVTFGLWGDAFTLTLEHQMLQRRKIRGPTGTTTTSIEKNAASLYRKAFTVLSPVKFDAHTTSTQHWPNVIVLSERWSILFKYRVRTGDGEHVTSNFSWQSIYMHGLQGALAA